MKSWLPLCIVNGMILAVVARVSEVLYGISFLHVMVAWPGVVLVHMIAGNCRCLWRYRRALLRSEAFRRRVEREQVYSEPYTWFQRDPNPEPLRNEEGF